MVGRKSSVPRALTVLLLVLAGTLILGFAESKAQGILDLYGEENVGTAGAQFLRIPAGARAAAMAQSAVASATDGSSLFWNPAAVLRTPERRNLFFGHTEYAADIGIEHAAYHWRKQNFGFGISAGMLRSGDIERTTELHQEGTGETFRADMYVLGLTVARAMTDRFSIGLTAKYYQENLDEFEIRAPLMDLGVLYFVGIGDLRVGFAVRNFGQDLKPGGSPPAIGGDYNEAQDFQSFSAPTSGSFGTAYTWGLSERMTLETTCDFHHPTDYSESFRFGGELGLGGQLFLRAGHETNRDEGGFSAGFGVGTEHDHWRLRADYAMRDMGAFGTIHMFSVDVSPVMRRMR